MGRCCPGEIVWWWWCCCRGAESEKQLRGSVSQEVQVQDGAHAAVNLRAQLGESTGGSCCRGMEDHGAQGPGTGPRSSLSVWPPAASPRIPAWRNPLVRAAPTTIAASHFLWATIDIQNLSAEKEA